MPNEGTKNLAIKELIIEKGTSERRCISLAGHSRLSGISRVGEGAGHFGQCEPPCY